jgi:hypothetical protein
MSENESGFGGEKPGKKHNITESYKSSADLEQLFDKLSNFSPVDRLVLDINAADVDFEVIPRLVVRFPAIEITIHADDQEDRAMLAQKFPWGNVKIEIKE